MGEVQPAPGPVAVIGGRGIPVRARTARWVAGCAAAGSVALIGGGLVLAYVDRHLMPASLTGWTVSNASGQVVNVAVPVVGFVLASRRPANPIGWLFVVAGLGLGLGCFSPQYGWHALVVAPGSWPAGRVVAWLSNWTWVIPYAMLALLFLLFPTGRLRSRRWRPAAWFVAGAFAPITAGALVTATGRWADPFTLAQTPPLLGAMFWLVLAALVVGVAAVVVRFARSAGEERLQLKWFAAAAVLVVATMIGSFPASTPVTSVLNNLAFLGLWTAIAVAVLKYRLYEIDRIISRTLAYAIVTGLPGRVPLSRGIARLVWGACATTPAYRGLRATSPI